MDTAPLDSAPLDTATIDTPASIDTTPMGAPWTA